MDFVLASHNRRKIAELEAILRTLHRTKPNSGCFRSKTSVSPKKLLKAAQHLKKTL